METKVFSQSATYLPELELDLPENTFQNLKNKSQSNDITFSINDFTSFSKISYNQTLVEPVKLFEDNENQKTQKKTVSFSDVKNGALIHSGQEGEGVRELQKRLNTLGFGIKPTGHFGNTTENVLKQFQKKYGIESTGKFGKTSLSALETAEKSAVLGKKLAKEAEKIAIQRDTISHCYNAVAESVDKIFGSFLAGESAYMSAKQFASNSKFKEIHVKENELPKLPAGSIVVWGKTNVSPHGHISVSLGNGNEASDHIERQRLNLRGYNNFRVFLPIKT